MIWKCQGKEKQRIVPETFDNTHCKTAQILHDAYTTLLRIKLLSLFKQEKKSKTPVLIILVQQLEM
jgi:hypothetical protein